MNNKRIARELTKLAKQLLARGDFVDEITEDLIEVFVRLTEPGMGGGAPSTPPCKVVNLPEFKKSLRELVRKHCVSK